MILCFRKIHASMLAKDCGPKTPVADADADAMSNYSMRADHEAVCDSVLSFP
jgi:hypothetical protein